MAVRPGHDIIPPACDRFCWTSVPQNLPVVLGTDLNRSESNPRAARLMSVELVCLATFPLHPKARHRADIPPPPLVPILLQKSPSRLYEIDVCNDPIGRRLLWIVVARSRLILNQCCATKCSKCFCNNICHKQTSRRWSYRAGVVNLPMPPDPGVLSSKYETARVHHIARRRKPCMAACCAGTAAAAHRRADSV